MKNKSSANAKKSWQYWICTELVIYSKVLNNQLVRFRCMSASGRQTCWQVWLFLIIPYCISVSHLFFHCTVTAYMFPNPDTGLAKQKSLNVPVSHHISVTIMLLQFCDDWRSSRFSCLFPMLPCLSTCWHIGRFSMSIFTFSRKLSWSKSFFISILLLTGQNKVMSKPRK